MTTPLATDSLQERSAGGAAAWWRDAVIYQIYPRSFADGNGDGMGDLLGVEQHLDYLGGLGIDAIWLSPFYVSPQADAGYDVADYRDVDPLFGTLADFDRMLAGAHARDLRVIVDLVPNHTSRKHAWFQAALAAAPGSPERERYLFREGRGASGELPPNNWQSVFGGNAWTRVADGQWYLHLFDAGQPDLNWRNPEVVEEFKDILRFWLDRGVDGFRIDVAHGLIKTDDLPDHDTAAGVIENGGNTGPMWDQEDVHDIYRGWNAVLREYGGDRILVAEAWVTPAERLSRYVRHDEMQQAFNFIYMTAGWNAAGMREAIRESLATNTAVGATTTWVLSNHDVVRHSSRFGLSDPAGWPKGISALQEQPDAALGLTRARAASLLMFALPGSAYLYEGEELGLPEHTTLPDDLRQDPNFFRSGGEETGRDGCRVPLPWLSTAPGYGFGPIEGSAGSAAVDPWLPQPAIFGDLAVDRQESDPRSTLAFYKRMLRLRRARGLGAGSLSWNDSPDAVIDVTVTANGSVRVVLNAGTEPVALPVDARVVLASEGTAVVDGALQPDCAVWVEAG